jgi:L-seryl-tRNA(Ser) seleniumtransferase
MTLPTLEELEQDPYSALGVRKFINATCHHTVMGGTLIPETSLVAMRSAADDFVDLKELQKAAGRVIAEITHADDGYIVSGCAAGLMVSAAAIITGTDEALIEQLPYVQGGQVPCIAKRFNRAKNYKGEEYVDHGYAMAVKTAGVKFIEVGEPAGEGRGGARIVTADEYEQAFLDNPDAKMVYWVGYAPADDIALEAVFDIAHAHDARVILDASNALPPRENLYRFIDLGADVVCFSGGKGIQGPQGSGIIAGSQAIIESIAMQSAPAHGIGRVAKVSKEEVVGQVSAFIWWAQQDDEERMTEHHRKSAMLHRGLRELSMVADSYIEFPDADNRPMPNVHVKLDPSTGKDAEWLIQELRNGEPAIATMGHGTDPQIVRIDVRLCEDDEIADISRRLHEILG